MPNNSKGLAEIHHPLRLGKTPTLMRMTGCEIVNLGIRAEFDKAFRRTIRRNPLDQQTPDLLLPMLRHNPDPLQKRHWRLRAAIGVTPNGDFGKADPLPLFVNRKITPQNTVRQSGSNLGSMPFNQSIRP